MKRVREPPCAKEHEGARPLWQICRVERRGGIDNERSRRVAAVEEEIREIAVGVEEYRGRDQIGAT